MLEVSNGSSSGKLPHLVAVNSTALDGLTWVNKHRAHVWMCKEELSRDTGAAVSFPPAGCRLSVSALAHPGPKEGEG